MEIATVTSKGQITIPATIRKVLNLNKGDKVLLEEKEGRIVMINASRHLNIDKLISNSVPVSSEEALRGVEPFEWSEEVLNGNKKVSL